MERTSITIPLARGAATVEREGGKWRVTVSGVGKRPFGEQPPGVGEDPQLAWAFAAAYGLTMPDGRCREIATYAESVLC